MDRIFFAFSQEPFKQLKPAFMSSYFKIIILDFPHRLKEEEYAFLVKMAEKHRRFFFLLRPYFLSNKQGNIWSRVRIRKWSKSQE